MNEAAKTDLMEAIKSLRPSAHTYPQSPFRRHLERVIDAAESWLQAQPAKPKTRLVSMWDLHWCTLSAGGRYPEGTWFPCSMPFDSYEEAEAHLAVLSDQVRCSKITGPRLQEVPVGEDPQSAHSEPVWKPFWEVCGRGRATKPYSSILKADSREQMFAAVSALLAQGFEHVTVIVRAPS